MVDNIARYGFRPFRCLQGPGHEPHALQFIVASGAAFDVGSGIQDASLRVGDLVTLRVGTPGSVPASMGLTVGNEGTEEPPWGVVMGILPHFDAATQSMRFSETLPSNIVWGTNLSRASRILVAPIESCIWEVDVDDIVTFTTETGYLSGVGLNVDFLNAGPTVGTNPGLEVRPRIDISTILASNGLHFRYLGPSPTEDNRDFAGANVKVLVEANLAQRPWSNATGVS
jgi:hypothetical protein